MGSYLSSQAVRIRLTRREQEDRRCQDSVLPIVVNPHTLVGSALAYRAEGTQWCKNSETVLSQWAVGQGEVKPRALEGKLRFSVV